MRLGTSMGLRYINSTSTATENFHQDDQILSKKNLGAPHENLKLLCFTVLPVFHLTV